MTRKISKLTLSCLVVLSTVLVMDQVFSAHEESKPSKKKESKKGHSEAFVAKVVADGNHFNITVDEKGVKTMGKDGAVVSGTVKDLVEGNKTVVVTTLTGKEIFSTKGARQIDDQTIQIVNERRIPAAQLSGATMVTVFPTSVTFIDGARLTGASLTPVTGDVNAGTITIRGADDVVNIGEGDQIFGVATGNDGNPRSFSGIVRGTPAFSEGWLTASLSLRGEGGGSPLSFGKSGANWFAIGSSN